MKISHTISPAGKPPLPLERCFPAAAATFCASSGGSFGGGGASGGW
jgi:uncharacterized membrane protein YgcG